jgi:outer membrane protein TolC
VAPLLDALVGRVTGNPTVRREQADARAAEARAHRERVAARPTLVVDLGADFGDPTLPGTNYRAQLAFEVPLFNARGAYARKEEANAAAARARSDAERTRLVASLVAAYRTFGAVSARTKALEDGVVPAAEAAADAVEESYRLGRAPLVAVLEAQKARIDATQALIEARAARVNAWIDVERAVGQP